MSGREKHGGDNPKSVSSRGPGPSVKGDWRERETPTWRSFPGPRGQLVPLRVAIDRQAFADLVVHAKESLDAEVCGVLAGEACEDDEGPFVHVQAVVRGSAARQGSAHVTFTHEAWNQIHATLERDHPKKRVLGWYHSHPGFGVEFSDMDAFIQSNFFSSPIQVALVLDPLGGDVALCRTSGDGIDYLDRFWVDGREHRARVPPSARKTSPAGTPGASLHSDDLRALENRIAQLRTAVDDQRVLFQRFLATVLVVTCLAIAAAASYLIYNASRAHFDPPKVLGHQTIPVVVDNKVVLVEIGVVGWVAPADVGTVYKELEEKLRARAQSTIVPGMGGPVAPLPTPPEPTREPR